MNMNKVIFFETTEQWQLNDSQLASFAEHIGVDPSEINSKNASMLAFKAAQRGGSREANKKDWYRPTPGDSPGQLDARAAGFAAQRREQRRILSSITGQ